MTDIVERLRQDATCTSHHDAADEIERLRAAESVALLDALRFHRERDKAETERDELKKVILDRNLLKAEAEIDRLREALREIMAHITNARGGLTYTECAVRDITYAALKETGHE